MILRERLFNFACVITRLAKFRHTQGPIAIALCAQLLRSGTSAGANYEEADDGSSQKDARAKRQIVLRELKETSFRLRVLRQAPDTHAGARSGNKRVWRVGEDSGSADPQLETDVMPLALDWKLEIGSWKLI